MKIEEIQSFCHSLPGTTEDLKWGCDIVFSVGKKMYAVIGMVEEGPTPVSFKTTPDLYGQLTQLPDIVPAPYVARELRLAAILQKAMMDQGRGR